MSLSKPLLEDCRNAVQFLVDGHSAVCRTKDHLTVLIFPFFARQVLGVEGKKEGSFAEAGY
jgi:hypothetical protein